MKNERLEQIKDSIDFQLSAEKNLKIDKEIILEEKELLDYITNLQKENERLKKKLDCKERLTKIMPEDTEFIILSKADYDRQEKNIELIALDYKSRNEKAIEFVKKESKKCYTNQTTDDPQKVIGNFMWHTDKLLNILNGGDEE